jgi:hypothetical protein
VRGAPSLKTPGRAPLLRRAGVSAVGNAQPGRESESLEHLRFGEVEREEETDAC